MSEQMITETVQRMMKLLEACLPSKEPERPTVNACVSSLERLQCCMRLARVSGPHMRHHLRWYVSEVIRMSIDLA